MSKEMNNINVFQVKYQKISIQIQIQKKNICLEDLVISFIL